MAGTISTGVPRNEIIDVLLNGKFQNIVTVAKTGRANFVCSDYPSDSACIQAALATGHNVYITEGMYPIVDKVTVPEHTYVFGDGIQKTVLILSKSNSLAVSDPILDLSPYSSCKYLSINGNSWTTNDIETNGVRLQDYTTLQNCEVYETGQYNIFTGGAKGAKIINNIAHHTRYPICLRGEGMEELESQWSDGCLVHGNVCYNYDYYMKIRGTKNSTVSNNICYVSGTSPEGHDGWAGIAILGNEQDLNKPYRNIKIDNNIIIDENGTGNVYGIYANPDSNNISTNLSISNNLIYGGTQGMDVVCNNMIIENNQVYNSRTSGIYVHGCDKAIITNNKIYNSGIQLNGINNSIICGNVVDGPCSYYRASGSGIFLWSQFTTGANGNIIENNTVRNCTAGSGIFVSKQSTFYSPTNTLISGNTLIGNQTPISDTSDVPATRFNNGGNQGTATITAGQTSINVTHGLAAVPASVILSPTTLTGGKQYYVSAKAASTFTITIDSTHTSNITFDWRAVV